MLLVIMRIFKLLPGMLLVIMESLILAVDVTGQKLPGNENCFGQ